MSLRHETPPSENIHNGSYESSIEAYGTFYHCEAVILYHHLAPEAVPLAEAVAAAGTMIRCFSTLYLLRCAVTEIKNPLQAPIPVNHPITWMMVHALCIAGTFLASNLANRQEVHPSDLNWGDVELCISLLSALEDVDEYAAKGLSGSLSVLLQGYRDTTLVI